MKRPYEPRGDWPSPTFRNNENLHGLLLACETLVDEFTSDMPVEELDRYVERIREALIALGRMPDA